MSVGGGLYDREPHQSTVPLWLAWAREALFVFVLVVGVGAAMQVMPLPVLLLLTHLVVLTIGIGLGWRGHENEDMVRNARRWLQ